MHRQCLLSILVTTLALLGTATGQDEVTIQPDIVYGHKDGLALTMDAYLPAEANRAAVAFMVSGGWVSRWAPPAELQGLFAPYLRKGYTVFAVRHGSSPRYGIPDAVADVRRSIRFLRSSAPRWKIDPERIGVLGMSAGGHLALVLATSADAGDPDSEDPIARQSSRVSAVAALVPPTDLTKCVWEAEESLPAYRQFPALDLPIAVAREYSPRWLIREDSAPALIISGTEDALVPPRHGRWMAEAYQSRGLPHKLVMLPADHGLSGKQAEALATVEQWFDQQLNDRAPKPDSTP